MALCRRFRYAVRFLSLALLIFYVVCTQYFAAVISVVQQADADESSLFERSVLSTLSSVLSLSLPLPLPLLSPQEEQEQQSEEEGKDQDLSLVPTVDCAQLLRDKQDDRLNFPDPNLRYKNTNRTLITQTSYLEPTFWISLHHKQYDPTRWAIYKFGRYYETSLERIWREILEVSPRHSVVVDVGMNIGYFSLVSLAVGRGHDFVVHSFEPNSANVLRMCESIQLNNWLDNNNNIINGSSGIFIHPVGVSDENLELPFHVDPANPGASRFYAPDEEVPDLLLVDKTMDELKQVVTLDHFASLQGWFDDDDDDARTTATSSSSPKIKILKVDVEALEHKVILGAKKLLQHHLVENIFLEVSARDDVEIANSIKGLSVILDAGYRLVGRGGFRGPEKEVPWKHNGDLVQNIVKAAKAEPPKQLNVWFQYPVPDNKAMSVSLEKQQQPHRQQRQSLVQPVIDAPINCTNLLLAEKEGTLGFHNPNSGYDPDSLKAYTTGEEPQFWVSLHNEQYDSTRWVIKRAGQYYERELEKIWRKILLAAPPGAKILDVGANIGYFSLLSLAVGQQQFSVESFEPNPVNILRLCESMQLNGWNNDRRSRLRIHPVGVSDRSDLLPFVVNSNPGASQFYPKDHPGLAKSIYELKSVISLDSLAEKELWLDDAQPKPTTIAILKVDVEGLEYRVLAGARKLLLSHLVQNVFMEVSARDKEEMVNSRKSLSILLETGYKLVGQGGFSGPSRPVPWPHDSNLVSKIIEAARGEVAQQLNVWFQPA